MKYLFKSRSHIYRINAQNNGIKNNNCDDTILKFRTLDACFYHKFPCDFGEIILMTHIKGLCRLRIVVCIYSCQRFCAKIGRFFAVRAYAGISKLKRFSIFVYIKLYGKLYRAFDGDIVFAFIFVF